MDDLEKYIEQNRKYLDVEDPDYGLSNSIIKKVNDAHRIRVFYKAAAILIVVVSGFIFYRLPGNKAHKDYSYTGPITDTAEMLFPRTADENLPKQGADSDNQRSIVNAVKASGVRSRAVVQKQPVVTNKAFAQYQEIKKQYNLLFDLEAKKIRSTPIYVEDRGYFNTFEMQLSEIKAYESELAKDLKNYDFDEAILDKMILLYQRKICLLKELRNEIRKTNNSIEQAQKEKPSKSYYLHL